MHTRSYLHSYLQIHTRVYTYVHKSVHGFHTQLPDDPEVTKKLKDRFEANVETMVTLLKAMGHEQVIDMKDASAN